MSFVFYTTGLVVYFVLVHASFVPMKTQKVENILFYSFIAPFILIPLQIYILFGLAYYRPQSILQYLPFSVFQAPYCLHFISTLISEVQAYNTVAERFSLRKHNLYRSIGYLYTTHMIRTQAF